MIDPAGAMKQVTGLIVAMEMPTTATDVGDCVIHPLPQPQETPPREGRGVVFNPAPKATGVLVVEPEVTFRAQHAITTVVPGDVDDSTAREIAQARFDRIVALLAVAHGAINPPPIAQVVAVSAVPTGLQQGDLITVAPEPSTRMGFYPMIVNPMSAATARRFTALDGMSRAEPHVSTLLKLWGAAEQADRTRFSDADRDACMVHYCKVVEQISIAMQPQSAEPTDEELAPIVSALTTQLQAASATTAQRVKAIDVAAGKLRELRFEGSKRRLRKSLETLTADADLRDGALEVWELRSSQAGHPSPITVTDAQVNKARLVAGVLVTHYFNWRWTQAAPKI